MATFSAVLYSSTLDKFYEAVAFLAAARARGDTGLLFLRGPALSAFTEDRWTLTPPFASESLFQFDGKTPMEFLKELHGHGKIRLYACSAWVRLLGLDNMQLTYKHKNRPERPTLNEGAPCEKIING